MRSIFGNIFAEEKCVLCSQKLTKDKNYCSTNCGHNYHTSCLLKRAHNKCPICRNELFEKTKPKLVTNMDKADIDVENLYKTILDDQFIEECKYCEKIINEKITEKKDEKLDVCSAFNDLDIFYKMEETPEHYGMKQMIDNVRKAYETKNIEEIKQIAHKYFSDPIDPEHPEVVVEWELYYTIKNIAEELENISK